MNDTIETSRDWLAHWTTVGQRTGRDELFRQVDRTIGGKPEPWDEIELLVAAITLRLGLRGEDVLLDLCCGNGLITERLALACRAVVGADYSPELIEVARERNAQNNTIYLHRAAEELGRVDFPMGLPTKVCMNAGLQCFTGVMTERLLRSLRGLAGNDLTLYITDVPDVGKLDAFLKTAERKTTFERGGNAVTEALGTWWDRDHIITLFEAAGYAATIIDPERSRLMAHYRFDILAHLST